MAGGLDLEASYGFYWRVSREDLAYNPGKAPLAPPPTSEAAASPPPRSRYTGGQVLLDASLAVSRFVTVSLRYERFGTSDYTAWLRPDDAAQSYLSATLLVRG